MEIIKIEEYYFNQKINDYFPNRLMTLLHIDYNIRQVLNQTILSLDNEIYMNCSREIKISLSNNLNYKTK